MQVIDLVFVLLLGGLVTVTLLKLMNLPTLFGYLVLGILIGPFGYQLITDSEDATQIAELGIMALMFTLGLKFSLVRIAKSKMLVFGLGGSQVGIGLALITPIAYFALDITWLEALLVASIITMSSTAVISKMLLERGELSTPHGIRSVSVLIFQDLAVIPLLILYAEQASLAQSNILVSLAEAAGILVLLLVIAPYLMPRIVNFFAQLGSSELFTIFILCMVVGISVLTHKAGLSLVLGSFIAGMLLAESRHRYLIEEIIRPYREIFLGFFFISIGLQIAPDSFVENWQMIVILVVSVMILKPLLIYFLVRAFGSHKWTAMHTGVSLGGTGEFGFVLLTAAAAYTGNTLLQTLLAVNLLCMATPPILIPVIEKIRNRVSASEWLIQARDLTRVLTRSAKFHDHVIMCGYGQNGTIIGDILDQCKIPWVAIENNHELHSLGLKNGKEVVFGDARHSETLIATGLLNAKILIVTHGIQAISVQTVQEARLLNKNITIIAKVLGRQQMKEVSEAGASHLSVAAIENGSMMASRTLQEFGVSNDKIADTIYKVHDKLLASSGADSEEINTTLHSVGVSSPTLFPVKIPASSPLVNGSVDQLNEAIGKGKCRPLYLQRGDMRIELGDMPTFQAGDVLFFRGDYSEQQAIVSVIGDGS